MPWVTILRILGWLVSNEAVQGLAKGLIRKWMAAHHDAIEKRIEKVAAAAGVDADELRIAMAEEWAESVKKAVELRRHKEELRRGAVVGRSKE